MAYSSDVSNTVAISTDLNVDPYYDDYNEEKNFHQILFRPGLAVQARELTQMQTLLQRQTSRFGSHVFTEGTVIHGGAKTFNTNISFVKITDKDNGNNSIVMSTLVGKTITGATTGVTGEIIDVLTGTQTAANTNTLYLKYTGSGTSKTSKTFSAGEVLTFAGGSNATYTNATVLSSANTPTGNGVYFALSDAIVYAKGQFIRHANAGIVVGRYTQQPSRIVGFRVNESIVTSNTDTTLLDPAQGAYNYTAPGANRLKLTTQLTSIPLDVSGDAPATNNFFSLFSLDTGQKFEEAKQPLYADLAEELARRTFKESGHYTARPFKFNIRENLIDGTNLGLKTSVAGGQANVLSVGIEGGHAFVKGFEYDYENLDTIYIDVNKGTNTQVFESVTTTPNYGKYVKVKEVAGNFDPTKLPTLSLRSATATAHTSKTFDATAAPGSELGTATLRTIKHEQGNTDVAGGVFRLYIDNVNMTASGKQFANVKSVFIANAVSGSSKNFLADTVLENANSTYGGSAIINEPTFNTLVYGLPFKGIKTIRDGSNSVETLFQFKKGFDITIATDGTASIATGDSSHNFTTTGTLSASQKDELFTIIAKNQVLSTQLGTVLANSTTTAVTGTGTKFDLLKVGDRVRLGPTHIHTVNSISSNTAMTIVTTPTAAQNVASGNAIAKVIESGQVVDMSMTGTTGVGATRSIVIGSTTSATLDLKEAFDTSLSARAIVSLNKVNAKEAAKTLTANVFVRINPNTHFNKTSSGPYPLGVTDGFKIRKIYMSTSNNIAANTTGTTDVTSSYFFESGQKAGHYDIAQIRLKSTGTAPTGQLLVNFDHFKHSSSLGQGYFSVDSYPVDDDKGTNSLTSIKTFQIPTYINPQTGDEYNLRNSIDLRPNKANTANPTTTISSAPTNPANSSTFTTTGDGQFLPLTGKQISKDLQIYLGRTDRLILDEEGRLTIKTGIASDKKIPPMAASDVMTLAFISIPPYPSVSPFVGKVNEREDLAVSIRPVDNRRFTMRDIGQLAERINRLEYYTSLSLLEKDAQQLQILDTAGLDRFKNGILVDNFTGHGVGEVINPDYKAAIDPDQSLLRPSFAIEEIAMIANTVGTSNVIRKPRDVFLKVNFTGANTTGITFNETVSGSTSGTTGRLKYNTSANADLLLLENETGSGFVVGETVTGATSGLTATVTTVTRLDVGPLATIDYDHNDLVDQPFKSTEFRISSAEFSDFIGKIELNPDFDNWVDTTTKPDLVINHEGNYDNWVALSDAWGTHWNDWNNIVAGSVTSEEYMLEDYGDYTESTALSGGRTQIDTYENKALFTQETVENRQTRTGIKIKAKPFINKETLGNRVVDVDIIPYLRSRRIEFTARGMRPATRVFPYFDDTLVTAHCKPTGGSLGGNLVTDAGGSVSGEFIIPNNSTLKFRVGSKPFTLKDDGGAASTTDYTTIASATYHGQGISQIEQETITSTREPIFEKEEVEENRTVFTDVARIRISNDLLSTTITNPASSCRRGCRRCFLAGTPITMEDGSIKHIEELQLGDKVKDGGLVDGLGSFLADNIYDYQGIYVAGSHAVKENGEWKRVEDSDLGKPLNDDATHIVYTLGCENKRIDINGITFTDYFETEHQDMLIKMQDEFPFEDIDFGSYNEVYEKTRIDSLNGKLTQSGFYSTLQ